MSETEARPPRGAAVDATRSRLGRRRPARHPLHRHRRRGGLIAVLAQGSSDALLLTLLASLAILGVFFLLGTAAGHIRLSERVTEPELAAAMADELDTAVLVTARDGTILYANAAMTDLLGRGASGAPAALEARSAAVRSRPKPFIACSAPPRPARCGARRSPPRLGRRGSATSRWLRIEVRPYRRAGREREMAS